MFGPRRYRSNSRLIVEQEETAALHSFISSASVYNLGLFMSCTDVWFFLFRNFSLLLWSVLQSSTLLCLHSVLFPWHACYLDSDEWPWWLCFLFTTAHPLSRRCKQANTCMGTKSILSTGASVVWDSFLFKRNGESDYLQMDKEGQRLQSAYFSIRLTWKKSIQTLHSCANKAPSVMTSVSEESSGGYWGQPSVMYPKPPCWPRSCIMCQESKFW